MSLDTVASTNEEYSTQDYWNKRYERETKDVTFDWFKSYGDMRPFIKELIPNQDAKILMLGCGNSPLSEEMWRDGYKQIVNIDYSPVVIEQMREKHASSTMEWRVMDIRNLDFEDQAFDVAIDKGTMDAMMAVKGDVWSPPKAVVDNCNKEVDEALRVLRPGGTFIYLTFGQPHFRKPYLLRSQTSLEIRQLGDAFHYYLYILRKEGF